MAKITLKDALVALSKIENKYGISLRIKEFNPEKITDIKIATKDEYLQGFVLAPSHLNRIRNDLIFQIFLNSNSSE